MGVTVNTTARFSGNLVVWLDGDDLDGDGSAEGSGESGLVAGNVSHWMNKADSGSLSYASPVKAASGTQYPNLATNSMNSRATVSFDGGDHLLLNENLDLRNATIFLVFSADVLDSNDFILSTYSDSNNDIRVISSAFNHLITEGGATAVSSSNTITATSNYVYSAVCGASSFKDFLNGTSVSTDASTEGWNNIDARLNNLGLGARVDNSGSPTRYFDGRIAEIRIYDSNLSDADRQTIESALGTKWGITIP